jgi:hypothetical protein
MFTAWLAWGVALLAVGVTAAGAKADAAAVAGGVLLGYILYLSYGLVVGMLIPAALLLLAPRGRRIRPFGLATLGVAVVAGAFTAAGFWWFDGYTEVRVIYAASIAQDRPYAYFVWADLAAVVFALGPATLAGLRRVRPAGPVWLILAVVAAIVVADLSGMAKGELRLRVIETGSGATDRAADVELGGGAGERFAGVLLRFKGSSQHCCLRGTR